MSAHIEVEISCDGVPQFGCLTPPADNMRDAIERGRRSTEPLTAYRMQRDAAAQARLVTGRKICRRCRTEKSLDGFSRARSNCDGRQYWCKACMADGQRERRAMKRKAAA